MVESLKLSAVLSVFLQIGKALFLLFSNVWPFISYLGFIVLAETSSIILSKGGVMVRGVLFLILETSTESFTTKCDLAAGFCLTALYQVEDIPHSLGFSACWEFLSYIDINLVMCFSSLLWDNRFGFCFHFVFIGWANWFSRYKIYYYLSSDKYLWAAIFVRHCFICWGWNFVWGAHDSCHPHFYKPDFSINLDQDVTSEKTGAFSQLAA